MNSERTLTSAISVGNVQLAVEKFIRETIPGYIKHKENVNIKLFFDKIHKDAVTGELVIPMNMGVVEETEGVKVIVNG